MSNIITKLNNLIVDGSPTEELIDNCTEIDSESCFEPLIAFLEECRKRWENRMNLFNGTAIQKIGKHATS